MARTKVKRTSISNKLQTKTIERRDLPLTILAWIGVLAVIFFVIQQIWHTIIILVFASVIAYLLYPLMKFLEKFMPRFLAIVIIYILLICGFGIFVYFFVRVAILQVTMLIPTISKLFIPDSRTQVTPVLGFFNAFGVSRTVVTTAGQDLIQYLKQFAIDILPFIGNFLNSLLSTIIIVVISIYLILDGERIAQWLSNKDNIPFSYRGKVRFFLNTLHKVVGAYIRGQLLLSLIIGILVGVGMAILQVPYALLLGMLTFIMEFVPVLGIFISGAACVLLALTQGWLIAVIVSAYFIGLHVIEADIVGPRIVGRALGIHPLVSLLAIITASDLFGIYGALFAAPTIGLLQAILIGVWKDWKKVHPKEFR
jgi:predicted PurR-regulated permease PerM